MNCFAGRMLLEVFGGRGGWDRGIKDAPGFGDDAFPVEGGAGIDLAGVEVIVAENSVEIGKVVIRESAHHGTAVGLSGEFAFEFGKDAAKGGGEVRE